MHMHINLHGLFNVKSILLEEKLQYYLIHALEDKAVHIFPKVYVRKGTLLHDWSLNSLITL